MRRTYNIYPITDPTDQAIANLPYPEGFTCCYHTETEYTVNTCTNPPTTDIALQEGDWTGWMACADPTHQIDVQARAIESSDRSDRA